MKALLPQQVSIQNHHVRYDRDRFPYNLHTSKYTKLNEYYPLGHMTKFHFFMEVMANDNKNFETPQPLTHMSQCIMVCMLDIFLGSIFMVGMLERAKNHGIPLLQRTSVE
ncbi:hypothetical protein ACJX0J_021958, partial [Zea mays]